MRKLYKSNHSVSMGGFQFIQRFKSPQASFDKVKDELAKTLLECTNKFQAEDTTVKVCRNHFHVFTHLNRNYAAIQWVEELRNKVEKVLKQNQIEESLDSEYVLDGIEDLSEAFIRKNLREIGEDL